MFQPNPDFDEAVNGLHGDCMEYALTYCLAAVTDGQFTPARLAAVVADLQQHNEAQSNGATNIDDCIDYARRHGLTIIAAHGFQEPLDLDLVHQVLLGNAGQHAIVLNVANGRVLRGDEPNLQRHGIAIIDKTQAGYICADGDQVTHGLKVYTWPEIAQAAPTGFLVLGESAPHPPVPQPVQGATYTIAQGDTLWGIIHAHGLHISAAQLASENAAALDAAARAHGYGDARGGNLIFPGTVIQLGV